MYRRCDSDGRVGGGLVWCLRERRRGRRGKLTVGEASGKWAHSPTPTGVSQLKGLTIPLIMAEATVSFTWVTPS